MIKCSVCDRAECKWWNHVVDGRRAIGSTTFDECRAHAVNWYSRAQNLQNKLDIIMDLSKNLKHGEECFKPHSYKDEIRCRCALERLQQCLAE